MDFNYFPLRGMSATTLAAHQDKASTHLVKTLTNKTSTTKVWSPPRQLTRGTQGLKITKTSETVF